MNERSAEPWSMSALLGALSLATDAANGVRAQTALRTVVIAVELARAAELDPSVVRTTYWTAMLRFLGCTSFAHETAGYAAGDDRALLRALQTADSASASSVLSNAWNALHLSGPFARLRAIGKLVAAPTAGRELSIAHCAQAESLSTLLQVSPMVTAALNDLYERWDGLGVPRGAREAEIQQATRVVHVAGWAEAHDAVRGPDAALDAVASMSGRALDPSLCALFAQRGRALLASVERRAYERAMELEPEPRWTCDSSEQESVFLAFARYADLKSPFTLAHSTRVADLVDRASVSLGLSEPERLRTRRAALVHDLGRVAVSNGVWDSVDELGALEREQIRSHATHTERVLALFDGTQALAAVASSAHERSDESGYPHQKAPRALGARLLAACDVACALREARPHRPAKSQTDAERVLLDEARAGRLDAAAVECVIALTRGRSTPVSANAALSEREVSVLALLARGASNKEIAAELGISPKTVQHHVAHVYDKTGVRSRAAAALYAVERGLLGSVC
jgi:HD-GYP domain-containing protein (c-di-GMP phosphodiesterase class II)